MTQLRQAGALVPLLNTVLAHGDLTSLKTNVSALFDMLSRVISAGLSFELAGFVTRLKQQITIAMQSSLVLSP